MARDDNESDSSSPFALDESVRVAQSLSSACGLDLCFTASWFDIEIYIPPLCNSL